jgi:hypothetical protein
VCKANASVSCSSLDDGAAWLQQTEPLGVLDDIEGGAVFDAATGVLELGLAQDVASGFFGETLEADERGLANCWTASAEDP